ncbi:uncharacterized protein LOC121730339 isoform X2 [Aricia agestis]|uniref:uncharacterized protein LOC121730339 isoform X2 n=1 Tax=Aricia agestis TaxID=91739 RepID=UPI001C20548B|nr:uncharacterized protein LOC121730339 isoform X2 [Aricia agestis]
MNKVIEIHHDTCRSRSDIRSAKDVYRISTSSLNKKELEDLYYSLFDNNLELKRTVNSQKDQIKVLTTRISRLTQKNIYSPLKGCNKNTLNEHKEIIIDLKQANEKLVERVRLLNMQLCSAKQFVKRNPLQTSRCHNCANIRNSSSITLLNSKRSQPNLRTKSTASQYEHDITPIILEETIKEFVPTKDQEECTQNKCRTAIEELQLKIQELEKELLRITEQYKNGNKKYTDYENVVSSVKEENLKIRSQARVCEERLEVQRKEYHELLKKLRSVEAHNESVSLELILEKQKTRELETQLKAAEISHNIVQALSQAVKVNRSHEPVRDESLLHMRADDSLMSMRVDESLMPMTVDEAITPMRVDESLLSMKAESLTPARAKSLIPVRVNESLTPLRDETTEKMGDSPYKVEQSDDSGYLEATNKFLEQGCGDIKLDKIIEHKEPKQKKTMTVSDDYKRKKRKGKSRNSKRDSSRESSIDGNLSRMSSNDGSENRIDKDSNVTEDIEQPRKDSTRRILKDIGVQSAVEYVSRAVGDIVADRTDVEVQIGDSLCAMLDIDTRTYSRKSNRTYSVHPAPAPPAPADNTEREISSLSDLPSERELTPSDYISPGEAVSSSEYSASWSELSEGELPLAQHKLSYGEVDANTSIGEHKPSISPERLNRAMKAAKEEADRVACLLDGRPVDLPGGTVNPLVLLRARYQ